MDCRFCSSKDGGISGMCRRCASELSTECYACGKPASVVEHGKALCNECYGEHVCGNRLAVAVARRHRAVIAR